MTDRVGTAALLCALSICSAGMASARELWESADGERSLTLDTSLKFTGLLVNGSDGSDGSAHMERARLRLTGSFSPRETGELAYGIRARRESGAATVGLLPSALEAPYRLAQLDWLISDTGTEFRHEIDRAFVAYDLEWGERSGRITLGRQAIGLGRGVLFGAVDIFSPFSPTEIDREWRRGVDAARLDLMLTDTLSMDLLAAFGEDFDHSAVIARLRGHSSESGADAELVVGKRGRDAMIAGTFSRAVGEAEMHLEAALFDVPESEAPLFYGNHLIGKLVLGGSHVFDAGPGGLWAALEYHYSGFGVRDITDVPARMLDPVFVERLARGDMQMLGQHAVAAQASYELNDAWSMSATWIASPRDGSGVVSPSFTWNVADNATMVISASLPHGAESIAAVPQSEYGALPASIAFQLSIYDR